MVMRTCRERNEKQYFYEGVRMTRWLILALVAFVLYKLITNEMRKRSKSDATDDAKEKARKVATGEMVKDPVCGTYVEAESSVSIRDGDVVHRFCSYECRDAFLQKLQAGGREIPPVRARDDEDA
jgi:YHS domain-containing protein